MEQARTQSLHQSYTKGVLDLQITLGQNFISGQVLYNEKEN